MDVGNVDECPRCEEEGLTEVQQLKKQISTLKAELKMAEADANRLDAESVKSWDECVLLRAELKEAKKWCFNDNTVRGLKAELRAAKEKLELGNNVADFLDTLYKQAPTLREEGLDNFDGYFCCLSEIQKACQSAWSSPRGFAESPTELIYQIIEERDRLQDALDEERGKVMEVYFYKLHNTNLSHCDYCLSSDKRHSWTRQQWTEEGRKQRK